MLIKKTELFHTSITHPPLKNVFEDSGMPTNLDAATQYLSANEINKLFETLPFPCVSQSKLDNSGLYYEEYIGRYSTIPTRDDSWHDFFNAFIWSKFPTTKTYLNHLHICEINKHGLHPRTLLRNNITLFDECGVVVLTESAELEDRFFNQDWNGIFCNREIQWFKNTAPVIFGHAVYEMLLQPFVGLTMKAFVLKVKKGELSHLISGDNLDGYLTEWFLQTNVLTDEKPFAPFPILGVPGWHLHTQDKEFYENKNYFMPKRRA